jgi:O-antigen/teichoic acid export membrane protein
MTFFEVKAEARNQGFAPTYSGALGEFHVLWRFSLPTVLSSLAQSPVGWLTNTILVNQAGGYAELGVYNAALRIKSLPDSLVNPFLTPILPALAERRSANDWPACKRIYSQAVALICLVVVPFCLLLMTAPLLAFLPYGKQYFGEPSLVRWLMLHGILSALCGPLGFVFLITGRMWLALVLSLVQPVLQIALAIWFVPTQKSTGLAIALAGAFAVQAVVSFYFAMRSAPQLLMNKEVASTLLVTALCSIAAWLMGLVLNPYLAIAAGAGLAFGFVSFFLRGQRGFLRTRNEKPNLT